MIKSLQVKNKIKENFQLAQYQIDIIDNSENEIMLIQINKIIDILKIKIK